MINLDYFTTEPVRNLDTVRKLSVANLNELPDSILNPKNGNSFPSKVHNLVSKLSKVTKPIGIDSFKSTYTLIYGKRGEPHIFIVEQVNEGKVKIIFHKNNSIEIISDKYTNTAKNITDLRENYSVDYLNNDMTWHVFI